MTTALNPSILRLVQAVNSAKKLTTLHISLGRTASSRAVLSNMSKHISTFPKLQTVSLADIEQSSKILICFLAACTDQLRYLELDHIVLHSGHWEVIFEFLLRVRLRSLHMNDLYERHDKTSWFRVLDFERSVISIEDGDFLGSSGGITRKLNRLRLMNEDISKWLSINRVTRW